VEEGGEDDDVVEEDADNVMEEENDGVAEEEDVTEEEGDVVVIVTKAERDPDQVSTPPTKAVAPPNFSLFVSTHEPIPSAAMVQLAYNPSMSLGAEMVYEYSKPLAPSTQVTLYVRGGIGEAVYVPFLAPLTEVTVNIKSSLATSCSTIVVWPAEFTPPIEYDTESNAEA